MDLDTITVADFKAQFPRDFPYLNIYDEEVLYNIGARVYYPSTELFYGCLVNGTIDILPTVSANWVLAEDSIDNYIQDSDITRAFQEAKQVFNQALWGTDESITLGFLYVTAYFLVQDIRASMAGIMANGYFPVNSRSVGNVSESYSIPASFTEDPLLSMYTANAYGIKYLTMVLPMLRGNVVPVCGATRP